MKITLAQLISVVFHPLIFAILLPFLIIYHRTKNVLYGLEWMIFSTGFIFLVIAVLFYLPPIDLLKDFDISSQKKRPIFYTVSIIFAIIYFFIAVLFKGIFFPLSIVALGVIIGLVIFELVNFYVKVSIHMAVATAYAITSFILYRWYGLFLFFWIPFAIAWSRLILKKHKPKEIIGGAIIGTIVPLLTFAIGRLLL